MKKFFIFLLDLSYEINPSAGFIYVKGKTHPQQILWYLKRSGKHATIEWISYGFPREDPQQNQMQDQGNCPNNLIPYYDPFYYARYPYDPNCSQLNHPYLNWYNMPQNPFPYGNHHVPPEPQHNGHMIEGRSFSNRSFDSHCPVRSRYHHSPDSRSPPPPAFVQQQTNDQTSFQPSQESSFFKKVADKFCFSC